MGYNLGTGEYNTPGILVKNKVTDAITKKEIEVKHKFVRLLTHPCYILQVGRLREERKSRLEKMLNLFDQNYRTSDKYILDVEDVDKEFAEMADYLSRPTYDEKFVRSLIYEEDYEKDLDKALKQKEKERRLKEEAQKREAEANQSLKKIIVMMLESGKSLSEIAVILGKTEEEVRQMVDVIL